MSVTNDPNYHEGQPVFGPTDAVKPTGETGARCPVCQSETVCYRDAHGWTISCRLRFTDAEASGIPIHTFQVYGETEDEVRKKIPILNAARPLPEGGIQSLADRVGLWLREHDGAWCCCNCGPSKTSRADWCDRGCGRDYNAMIRIDYWRMPRLFALIVKGIEP